jgi:phenylalanyl-tRNA synthetase beta chain
MRIAIDWLQDFVTLPGNTQKLANTLTMLGLEADDGLDTSQLGDIIIGQVKECIKHPNADKLSLCKVYDGKDTLQIVCGAFNVKAGQKIAFAPVGAVLPGEITLTKAKIRGEESLGMICSEKELGISEEHDGIMVLNKVAKVGTSFINYWHNYSKVLELDITPNRPDCFSHLGIARDLSVKKGSKIKSPNNQQRSFQKNEAENWIKLKFENENDCPRYIAGIVQNVKVGPSPLWLKDRLESIGQRSINNLVDISNYVMMDIGHPTHIFDYDKLGSKEILIRRGKKGEKITTLDEVERKISQNELLITNGKKPIAIAGVMGGLDTAVNENTSNVLIESAYFEASVVRKGAKSLGMSTDASKRFERGADPIGAENAFWHVIDLLEEIAGGKWIPGIVDP